MAHASELGFLFGPVPELIPSEADFANQMLDFYINFINDMDPGGELPASLCRLCSACEMNECRGSSVAAVHAGVKADPAAHAGQYHSDNRRCVPRLLRAFAERRLTPCKDFLLDKTTFDNSRTVLAQMQK